MILSPIWSIITLTNKWHAVLFGGQLQRLRERLEKTDLKKTVTIAQDMQLSLVHPHKNLARWKQSEWQQVCHWEGKRLVIIGLFQQRAACLSMWKYTYFNISQCLAGSGALCWPKPLYTGTKPSMLLSSKQTLTMASLFCIHHLLLFCQLCGCVPETSAWWGTRQAVCRTIGLSFHFHMIDGSPPKAWL